MQNTGHRATGKGLFARCLGAGRGGPGAASDPDPGEFVPPEVASPGRGPRARGAISARADEFARPTSARLGSSSRATRAALPLRAMTALLHVRELAEPRAASYATLALQRALRAAHVGHSDAALLHP